MAALFDDAGDDSIQVASAILTGVPISMACWFNTNDISVTQSLMTITDASASDNFQLFIQATQEDVRARTRRDSNVQAASSAQYTADTWRHACAVFAAVDDRRAFLDGGNKGTESTSQVPINLDVTTLGALRIADVVTQEVSGLMAEAAIWNVALSDDEVAVLGQGYSPLFVHPQNLVFYAPLIRTIQDVVGAVTLTNDGSTVAAHTRIRYPAPGRFGNLEAPVSVLVSKRLLVSAGR